MTDPSLGAEASRHWSLMRWVCPVPSCPHWGSLGKPFLSLGFSFLLGNANGNPSMSGDAGRRQAQSRHSRNVGSFSLPQMLLGRGCPANVGDLLR